MPFPRDEVDSLLAACHRRCCICHRFCGVKIETDHIAPAYDGGSDSIENAIPVCFECHAEIHSYNDQHPRGRKFRPTELRRHKAQWLEICQTRPDIFLSATRTADVGPLQALLDELEFNTTAASLNTRGCPLQEQQFHRAIAAGAISVLEPALKKELLEAYAAVGRLNQILLVEATEHAKTAQPPQSSWVAIVEVQKALPRMKSAQAKLLSFLSSEGEAGNP